MRKTTLIITTFFLACSLVTSANANDEAENLDPEVTIINNDRGLIEEYRSNGRLYMIKVRPNKGPAYFLVDADGDGDLETRTNELAPNLLIPSWVLFSW